MFGKEWDQIVAKAWADKKYKKRLLADPVAVLEENGLAVPVGMKIKVVENTDKLCTLILPLNPDEAELTDAELKSVTGGRTGGLIKRSER